MTIEIKDWTKQIEDLKVMGLDQLHETYSEMLATAHDIGYKVPDDQLVETDDDNVLRAVIEKLHPAIVDYAATAERPTETAQPTRAKKAPRAAKKAATTVKASATKKVASKSPKKQAKDAEQKGEDVKESTNMATNTAKKTAKKATAKKAAKGAKKGATKKAAANARTPVARSKFKPEATINVKIKENPAREGSGRHDRIQNLMKHNGKTVEQFLKSGGKSGTLNYSVEQGWITVK